MLRPLMLAWLGTSFTFLMTALGAATVFFFARAVCERAQGALLGFAAGVMTAASVWSLILPAIEQTAAEGRLAPFLPAAAGIVLGALLLALLDEFTRQRGGERVTHSDFLLLSAITLHNIPEGMAVGLAFALAADGEGLAGAAALALGIGVQNFPEGAAVALPLYQSGQSKLRAFVTGVLSGAVEPLFGVLVVLAAARVHALMPWLLSFAAGAMLYVVAEELLPRAGSRRGTCGFLVGFLFMMVLDVALG
ncbi:MAG: ZIP family metal transporter [Oscillibacter sp.]|nr:ZIP family metal transporter [Oscillibacter sp.]MDY4906780.1 ZIP family metal transporter [Oscillospiraceae bacterium]